VSNRAKQDDGDVPAEIVLVTGSSSGIGKACCERSARSPHVVARKVEMLLRRKRMPASWIAGTPIEVLAVRLKATIPGRGFEDLFRRFYGL
jgi:NAD(P)-dependent dehydrogenase (short-subunit alcohol dehydrogenase family)